MAQGGEKVKANLVVVARHRRNLQVRNLSALQEAEFIQELALVVDRKDPIKVGLRVAGPILDLGHQEAGRNFVQKWH